MMGPTEFAQLVDAHGPALQLYARQWCDVPEDVVQDAFVKLFTARERPTDVAAWLYRVVRNAAMDAAKTSRRRKKREAAAARPERWFAQEQAGASMLSRPLPPCKHCPSTSVRPSSPIFGAD
jgi:DNA-directed RNA polymerase specialized sigma24 family protein